MKAPKIQARRRTGAGKILPAMRDKGGLWFLMALLAVWATAAPFLPVGSDTVQAASLFERVTKTLQGIDVEAEAELRDTLPKASAGDPAAQFKAGQMYREGKGTPQNDAEALKWYRLAAEQGHAQAQFALGRFHEEGIVVAKNEYVARQWYQKAGEQGYAPAQSKVGYLYEMGLRVTQTGSPLPQDDAEAVKWYRRAADQGNAAGQSGLGYLYETGRGVPKNQGEAARLYRKAAEQGDARGQWGLGGLFANGLGVQKNDTEAVRWFRMSAEQGYAGGQYHLGYMYATGRGVAKDESAAVAWIRKAAEQGYAGGQHHLGYMYSTGRGVAKDDQEAVKWMRKAAEQGHAAAQCNLGIMLKQGRGVPRNHVWAGHWLRKAILQGNTTAIREMQGLYDQHGYRTFSARPGEFTLDAYLTAQSLAVKNIRHSADGAVLLTRASSADGKYTDVTLWRYDVRGQAYTNDWFSIRVEANTLGSSFDLSADGSTLALHRNDEKGHRVIVSTKGAEKTIPLKWYSTGGPMDGRRHLVFALNHDHSEIAVAIDLNTFPPSETSSYSVQTYAVATGTLKRKESLYGQPPERLFFDPQKRFLLLQEKYPASSQETYLLEAASLKTIHSWYGAQCFGFNDDGSLLALKKGGKMLLLNPEDRKEHPLESTASTLVFGPENKVLLIWNNGFEEHLVLPDRRTAFLQLFLFKSDPLLPAAFYVHPSDTWYGFRKGQVLTMKTISRERRQATLTLQEGRALLAAGFHREGIEKIKAAFLSSPLSDGFNSALYRELEQAKTPLAAIGDLLLFQIGKLLKAEGPGSAGPDERREALALAVYRLANYGTFAVKAGHPHLAKQAAQRIRQLRQGHPDAAPWEGLLTYAVALEALVLAVGETPERAYSHILQEGGLTNGEENQYQISNIQNYPDDWTPLYADRKKLAYILQMDEAKLPRPKAIPPTLQPYPDLNGRLITPVTAPPRLESAPLPAGAPPNATPPGQGPAAPQPKARILD